VPFVVVSPYARAGYVSHTVHSHTSMTRFIEAVWNIGALTERDANSDALLDMFDFGTPALAMPPAAVDAGMGGCNRDGGP
jgi:phospholipase C